MKHGCPQCNGVVELRDDYHGQRVTCPHCKTTVQFRPLSKAVAIPAPVSVADRISATEVVDLSQDTTALHAAVKALQNYCTPEETILQVVIQSRWMAGGLKTDLIAATNRRIIILKRGLFGCQLWDVLWIDVHAITIEESFLGATLSVTKITGHYARLHRLPKPDARTFYRFCQPKEELMRARRHAQRLQVATAGAPKVNVNLNQ